MWLYHVTSCYLMVPTGNIICLLSLQDLRLTKEGIHQGYTAKTLMGAIH